MKRLHVSKFFLQLLIIIMPLIFVLSGDLQAATVTNINIFSGNYDAVGVNPVTNKIYAMNYNSGNVVVINGVDNSIINTLTPSGWGSMGVTVSGGPSYSPSAIAVNPITNRIYIAHYGTNTVTVVNGTDDTVINTFSGSPGIGGIPDGIPVGTSPMAIAVNVETNMVYVANNVSNSVSVINGSTNSVSATVTVGSNPRGIAVNPVTNRIYVANYGGNSVSVIDGSSSTVAATVSNIFSNPERVAVNPVTNKIYVGVRNPSNITVINGADNTTTTTAGTPISSFSYAPAVAVNPVTNMIYVADGITSGTVAAINGIDNSQSTAITVGNTPGALAVNPVTNTLYVGNQNSTYISSIDCSNWGAGATTISGLLGSGWALGVNPTTNAIYVPGYSNTYVNAVQENSTPAVPLATAISTFAGNSTASTTPSFTLNTATGANWPTVLNAYYQLDSTSGPWQKATIVGTNQYSAASTTLTIGSHTIYAFATDGQDSTSVNTGSGASPLIGAMSSYTFTVTSLTVPAITLTPSSAYFFMTHVGTPDTPQTVTLTNSGSALLTISSLSIGGANPGDFTLSGNTCGATVAVGASCTFDITFTPQASGSRVGALVVLSDAANSPVLNTSLSGNGGYTLIIDNPDGTIGSIAGGVCGDGCEINCGLGSSSCSGLYASGTVLNFFQTPAPGGIFTGWSGSGISCPGNGNCSVTIAGDMTLNAGFCNSGTFSVAPSFSISSFQSVPGSFSVTPATGSCSSWTAGSTVPWLSLSSGANGSGSGTVSYSVAAGPELRGTITAAGQTFNLLRKGGGGLDSNFNYQAASGFGYATLSAALGSNDWFSINAATLQSDGKIVVTGYETSFGTYIQNLFVARFNQDGTKDSTFGAAGSGLYLYTDTGNSVGTGIAIQSDGRIIVSGYRQNTSVAYNYYYYGEELMVIRLDGAGALDPTFNSTGIAAYGQATTLSDLYVNRANAVAIDLSGTIVAAGYTSHSSGSATIQDALLARFTSAGILDTGFNTTGISTHSSGTYSSYSALAILPADNSIVAVGSTIGTGYYNVLMTKTGTNGVLMTTGFGTGGIVTYQNSVGSDDSATAVKIQDDGKIVVAGSTAANSYDTDVLLLRYDSSGVLDSAGFNSLGAVPGAVVYGYTGSYKNEAAKAVTIQSNGKIVIAGSKMNSTNDDDVMVLRYKADGTVDTSFGSNGLATFDGPKRSDDQAKSVMIDSNGNIVVAGSTNGTLDGLLLRLIAKATPIITWGNPADITYGIPMSSAQLNASSGGVSGTFSYAPGSGTILNAGAGQTLSAIFTPTDTTSYNIPAAATVTISVAAAGQAISFGTTPALTYGGSAGTISATATSGLPVTFSSQTSGVCTVIGNTVTPVSAGTCTIAADQGGNGNYSAASQVTRSVSVAKITPVITWATPADITYGTALSSTQLSATASTAGSFAYSPASGTLLGVGAGQALSVLFTPGDTANYAIQTAGVSLNVAALPANQVTTGADGKTTVPISVTASGAHLSLASGTLLTDAAGNPISGTLTVTASLMSSIANLPSGLATAQTSTGTVLSALGNSIDMAISAGTSQVKNINPAMTVNLAIPATFAGPGAKVSYYSFDGTKWNQEGTATVKPDGTVDMLVSHFSVWAVATFASSVDIVAPDITGFTIPAMSSTLTVPISSFIATDAVGVSGYLLSESATTPIASDPAWTAAVPTAYSFPTWGNHTLYAYAKDGGNNISAARSALVYIGLKPEVDGVIVNAPLNAPLKVEPQLIDAIKSLNFAMKVETPTATELLHGDVAPLVNGIPQPDGEINLGDTIVILRRVVGL